MQMLQDTISLGTTHDYAVLEWKEAEMGTDHQLVGYNVDHNGVCLNGWLQLEMRSSSSCFIAYPHKM